MNHNRIESPQIKICGLTQPDEALACVEAGIHAIGLVFYPPSPRVVSDEAARDITGVLPDHVVPVGVFVDESYDYVMERKAACRLRAVQLHGNESPELVDQLMREDVRVIKALFHGKHPTLEAAGHFRPTAFLAECAGGTLPGGNALRWDWRKAQSIDRHVPVILAGGLTPDNVTEALKDARPDAVDVSSGVEILPGRKDIDKVRAFVKAVAECAGSMNSQHKRSIFE